MSKKGNVFYKDFLAGIIEETEEGYLFSYDKNYIEKENAKPISLTMPLITEVYQSKIMFPFFDGLIPEGWLLDIVQENWKINPRDRMTLLLTFCKDCIGAVSVIKIEDSDE